TGTFRPCHDIAHGSGIAWYRCRQAPSQYDGGCSRPTSLIGRDDAGGDNALYRREAAPMLRTGTQPRQGLAMSFGAVALVTRKPVTRVQLLKPHHLPVAFDFGQD